MRKSIINLFRHYSVRDLFYKVLERITEERKLYCSIDEKISEENIEKQRIKKFIYQPLISILVPTYETEKEFLEQLLETMLNQTYANWELCIADASETSKVEDIISLYQEDKRIIYKRLKKNEGIAENTNEAYKIATGDYIGLLDHDDILADNALYEVVEAINKDKDIDFIYTDEDKMNSSGNIFYYPHRKPDYNKEYLRTNNYICHFVVVKKELVDKIDGWRKEFDGAQDFDFVLRCTELAVKIKHIPKILYHWRVHEKSTSANKYSKMYAYEAGRKAVEEHLERCNEKARVSCLKELGTYKVSYQAQECDTLKQMNVKKFWETDWNVEWNTTPYIIIMDDKVKRIYTREGECFSAECESKMKIAVKEDLLGFFQRDTVSIVAAKCVDRRKVLQNGIRKNLDGTKEILMSGLNRNFRGYFKQAVLPQNVDGAKFDFVIIKTETIKDVQLAGLDEEQLCDCLRSMGLEIIQVSDFVVEK